MRDYYPVIARAVSRLESNSLEARHELFERIRRILIDQLRIQQPSPTSSELSCERASLEAAIQRVELEFLTTRSLNRPRSVKNSNDPEAPSRIEHLVAPSRPCEAQEAIDGDRAALGPVKAKASRSEGARGIASFRRLSKANAGPVLKAETQFSGSDCSVVHSIAAHDQPVGITEAANGFHPFAAIPCSDDQSRSSRVSDLFSIRCLNELLQAGAEQLAPESLRRDSAVILTWLAVPNSGAIGPEHYELFTQAFRTYMTECNTPDIRRTTIRGQSSTPINDDLRALFNRMLEREQAAVVFEDALTSFALLWSGLMLGLNLIVGVVLIVAAPTIAAGLGTFAVTYSPFNLWCWVCQALAISPAAIAIYAKRERISVREYITSWRRMISFGTAKRVA